MYECGCKIGVLLNRWVVDTTVAAANQTLLLGVEQVLADKVGSLNGPFNVRRLI